MVSFVLPFLSSDLTLKVVVGASDIVNRNKNERIKMSKKPFPQNKNEPGMKSKTFSQRSIFFFATACL